MNRCLLILSLFLLPLTAISEPETPAAKSELAVSTVTIKAEYFSKETNGLTRVTSVNVTMRVKNTGLPCLFDAYPNAHRLTISVDDGPFQEVTNIGTRAIRRPESIVNLASGQEIDIHFRGSARGHLVTPIRSVRVRFTYPNPSQFKGFEESLRRMVKDKAVHELPFWFGTVTSPKTKIVENKGKGNRSNKAIDGDKK